MSENKNKLVGKIFITGRIKTETGLHIGGSKTDLDIGGIDLNVIKTPAGVPFIPGSSLKGKLRSLLARLEGSDKIENDSKGIKELFGESPTGKENKGTPTQIFVRDAFFKKFEEKFDTDNLETNHTESKWENSIDRKSGTADNPRQLERVPAGAYFDFEMVYNDMRIKDNENDDKDTNKHIEMIVQAMKLLEDDYLGGHGSRGYGKIKFYNVAFNHKTVTGHYLNGTKATPHPTYSKYAERFIYKNNNQ